MRSAGFVALLVGLVGGTTPQPTKNLGREYNEVYRRCYDEVSQTAKYLPHPSRRSPMDAAAFEAVKECAARYLK
jgi:hypothetical protein